MTRFARIIVIPLLLGVLALFVACTQQQPSDAAAPSAGSPNAVPVTVEVEVTSERVVLQTVVATVAVPVEVTREVFVEVTQPPPAEVAVGSADRPLLLVFTPHYGVDVTTRRATALVDALSAQSGLMMRAAVPATGAEAVELACSDPTRTVAFLTVLEYALAAERCDLQIGFAGVRDGIAWSAGMLVARTTDNNSISTLADADGRTWGVANPDDLATGLYYEALFAAQGIEPGAQTAYETEASTLIAGIDQDVDFVTATFLPPILPYNERLWVYGEDDPELWRRTGSLPFRSGIGFAVVVGYVENGGYRVRDARASVLDTRERIFADTAIIDLSPPIPNDAVALGTRMPLGVARAFGSALSAHTASEACTTTLCSSDFFHWEGVAEAETTDYDVVRFTIDELGLNAEDVLSLLD